MYKRQGIAYYEKDSFAKAIDFFDKSMSRYSDFSDAEFYKAMSLMKLKNNLSKPLFEKALGDFDKGYTFTEEYAIYQIYPYQITREQIEFFIQKNSK